MNLFRVVTLLVIFLFSGTVFAQQHPQQHPPQQEELGRCLKREDVTKRLTGGEFKEYIKIIGLIDEDQMLEIWTNEQTGTWTAFITKTNGISCVVSAGENLMILPTKKLKGLGIIH